ncbi:MAG TPA: hypothetical protein VK663_07035 [Burkholderiales bacterium]|nr:hypothetical protein [Burkholderiales bacterium]
MKRFTLAAGLTISISIALAGCIVAPAPIAVGPPPGVVLPPGVVYVAPTYAIPAPGYVWVHHPRYGWGWRHSQYGWHRGWR